MPFLDELRSALSYCPDTGELRWIKHQTRRSKVGKRADLASADGYRAVFFGGRLRAAHRLAWLYVHGECPAFLDHINGDRQDNRLANLRPATKSQNQANRAKNRNNTSGYKGVRWESDRKKWRATFAHKMIGRFDTAEQAHAAYCDMLKQQHGEYARFE
jgi:hypothetical protein